MSKATVDFYKGAGLFLAGVESFVLIQRCSHWTKTKKETLKAYLQYFCWTFFSVKTLPFIFCILTLNSMGANYFPGF